MIKYLNVADLHVHTSASDGAYTLPEVARMARDAGIEIIGVTDHDNVSAFDRTATYAVEVVPGVELSAELENREVHILGFFLDVTNDTLLSTLTSLQAKRRERFNTILERLGELHVDIDPRELLDESGDTSVGRLHVAELLIRGGYVTTVYEAFRDYLGPSGKAFVPKERLSVAGAVALIHGAGGAAVLAHPGVFFTAEEVRSFVAHGLDGVEAYYPSHPPTVVESWAAFAEANGLVVTGGSDFHGREVSETELGAVRVPRQVVEALRERSGRYGAGRIL